MDDVIMWCQNVMGKEFLVNGKVAGKDLNMTRAPQHYGFHDLDTFMKVNRYVPSWNEFGYKTKQEETK